MLVRRETRRVDRCLAWRTIVPVPTEKSCPENAKSTVSTGLLPEICAIVSNRAPTLDVLQGNSVLHVARSIATGLVRVCCIGIRVSSADGHPLR